MFKPLKQAIEKQFLKLTKSGVLLYKEVDREKVWEAYLSGFSESERQAHNCNCCKSFIRQYSGIVGVAGNSIESIWDVSLSLFDAYYHQAITNIKEYVDSLSISNVMYFSERNLGTDRNVDSKRDIVWDHFSLNVPTSIPCMNADSIASKRAIARTNVETFKRGLEELTMESLDTVLELIAQNSIYRGAEFKNNVHHFKNLKAEYTALDSKGKEVYLWSKGPAINVPIRNTAIGTLLVNLSEGMAIDTAVNKYEAVVAPHNYKRPKPVVTESMVKKAKEKLSELGYLESIERRFAHESDIDVNNLLYVDRSSQLSDVFGDLTKGAIVDSKTLSKVEEMFAEDFFKNVLPTAKSIEVVLENKDLNNLVSIITAKYANSPTMFKWANPFSWSYTGGITDSIKERVKAQGGNVVGELRISLSWFNLDDLDLHVIEPNGNRIYFSKKTSVYSGGYLDVDMNAGHGSTRNAVENIIFTNKVKMMEGEYKVLVNNYCLREKRDEGYEIEIEQNGTIYPFSSKNSPRNQTTDEVVSFIYSKKDGLTFKGTPTGSKVIQKEKWGIKTNSYVKVRSIMLSPNHWNETTGNKHYFFILEDCINKEEPATPFFNEFMRDDMRDIRKVIEVLGSKIKVDPDDNQLSGVGYSETKTDSLILRVTGSFKRTIKIIF